MASEQYAVPTFAVDDDLPRAPVPAPRESCDLLLEWAAPLLSEQQQRESGQAVEDFLRPDGPGEVLHERLVAQDADEQVATWLDPFFHERYFSRRAPVAVNANYFFLFEDSPLGQVDRAAALIGGALAFKQLVDAEQLPAQVRRGEPQTTEENKFLFSSTRIPGDPMDTDRTPYSVGWPGPSRERHVLVLHGGRMLALDVLDEDGRPYRHDELAAGLREALAASADPARPDEAVGHLTTLPRARWARVRQGLLDAGNATEIDLVERALFCVCLEDDAPEQEQEAADRLLHGDSGSRWFDKSVQFVVFGDGRAGFNGEHCRLDGTTAIRFLDAVLEHEPVPGGERQPQVRPLTFRLDEALRGEIGRAATEFATVREQTATTSGTSTVGADRIKELGCSPDAFAQLAFQLTQRRVRGSTASTYESIAATGFRHGRTEAMRVVTPQVVAFVDAMTDPASDPASRAAALHAAAEAHVARAADCRAGRAPEQPLWAMQMIHQRDGGDPIDLYACPAWEVLRAEHLSTSAVPSTHVAVWGFGPTGDQCVGIAYAPLPERLTVYLSAPAALAKTLDAFRDELLAALEELADLLATTGDRDQERPR